jgi:hypothetical protein
MVEAWAGEGELETSMGGEWGNKEDGERWRLWKFNTWQSQLVQGTEETWTLRHLTS